MAAAPLDLGVEHLLLGYANVHFWPKCGASAVTMTYHTLLRQ